MNKIESRHKLILSLIKEKKLHTQQELQELLELNGVTVTQSTLSRDIKLLNLVKVNEDASSYYMVNPLGKTPPSVCGRCSHYTQTSTAPSCIKNTSRTGQLLRLNS